MDIVAPADPAKGPQTLEGLKDSIQKIKHPDLQKILLLHIQEAEGSIQKARESIEKWFDDSMERITGWYKRRSQLIVLCVSAATVILLNIDTIHITNTLFTDNNLRAGLVAAAEGIAKEPAEDNSKVKEKMSAINAELEKLSFPMGWPETSQKSLIDRIAELLHGITFTQILGWLITVCAVSLGAPFWFDTLSKFINIRSGGIKPGKTSGKQEG